MSLRQSPFGVLIVSLLIGGSWSTADQPVGTALTFQSRLKDGGLPAEGPHDFVFRLFDHSSIQVGGDITMNGHPIINGLFSVDLDFGPGVFTSDKHELEIQVDGVVLTPRQPLNAMPYAMDAIDGLGAVGTWAVSGAHIHNINTGNVGIGTSRPTSPLHVSGTAQIMEKIATSHTAGSWLELENTSIGGKRWALVSTGSANGEGAGKMLLRAMTDGRSVMTLQGNGNVGIGATNPAAKLHVGGTAGTDGIMFPDGTLQTTAAAPPGALTLPVDAAHAGSNQSAFSITETGTGHAGSFNINNLSTSWAALFASSNGLVPALHAVHSRGKSVAQFENTGLNNTQPTVLVTSNGTGAAIQGTTRPGMDGSGVIGHSNGDGNGVEGSVAGSGNAIHGTVTNNLGRAAYFQSTSAGNSTGAVLIECNGDFSSKALRVDSTGEGDAGYFEIQNPSSDGEVVEARTNGTGNAFGALHTGSIGRAGYFIHEGPSNTSPGVEAVTRGLGRGAHVEIDNVNNNSAALFAKTDGDGPAVDAETFGLGPAAELSIKNANSTNSALFVNTIGRGRAALFQANNTATTVPAVQISTQGSGPALEVSGKTELNGDVEVGGNVIMGYEIVTATQCDTLIATVQCPAGKRVLGGGCFRDEIGAIAVSWKPFDGGTAWYCQFDEYACITVHAICANVR